MRGFDLTIISDGVLANSEADRGHALDKMETLLKAKVVSANSFILQLKK